ncbi:hypothetical protein GCM10009838_66290 [Catenulispora subtropica]|uniref:Insertion element IS402-like domain-containing protein n=1 Tax=Catenulispora subtropica TaxID=450798 RepID=A0ABN2SVP7_9ACTN
MPSGGAATAAADRPEARTTPEMDETPAHQRAIRWRTRIGAPWREIPERYGPWQNAYGLFRTWSGDGTWTAVLTKLQAIADAAGLTDWYVSIDSTISLSAVILRTEFVRRLIPTQPERASAEAEESWPPPAKPSPTCAPWPATTASCP